MEQLKTIKMNEAWIYVDDEGYIHYLNSKIPSPLGASLIWSQNPSYWDTWSSEKIEVVSYIK